MYKHSVYILLLFISNVLIYPQSMQDLQKMKSDYDKLKKDGQEIYNQQTVDDNIESEILTNPSLAQDDLDSVKVKSKFFGYDYFNRNQNFELWDNLPVSSNYIIGVGDEIIISLWGQTQLRKKYIVSREGTIYDEKVGLLNIVGKTINDTDKYLKSQFGRIYSTILNPNPSTFMDVSVGKLMSINVSFVGELKIPGVYPIHAMSNLLTGLVQAGGIDTTGSLRNIIIKRNNKVHANVDMYDYLLNGALPKNIQLRDQDIVFVPIRLSTVTIDSLVMRSGIYESKPGETISQMISYAGGLAPNASSSIGISRVIPISKREANKPSMEKFYVKLADTKKIFAQDGDTISINKIFETISQVEIIGQVKNPGEYFFYEGMTLKELIDLGGGFNDSTFLKTVYVDRCELIRRDPNSRYEKVIEYNLSDLINNKRAETIKLQNLDRFVVHSNLNFFERKNIQILGEVNIPGSYPLLRDNESLQSFIDRAGGFTSKAFNEGIEIFRDSLRVAWENTNISLFPGDSVVINERPGVIFITGEVYNQGLIEYQKGKSIRYYIDAAGGVTINGDKNDVIVIHPNGKVIPKKMFRLPEIVDGSTIVVNEKEILEPFDLTSFTSNILSIISTTVTIIVLSRQLQPAS